ncbi:class F sortase [Micromonospora sp. NBC_01655]|uniref:class F sortase n=1 Tax=Micromonospora sp. NBC_01655 TaxID=2975983 RepID=UPI002258B970|nr:class F sortase [Micromonospora sp. NBC_01655]MCX4470357.1 class F sortase [Micromonospora sp. NBC_01655]
MTATPAGGRHGRPWRAAGAAVVVMLAMVGAGLVGASLRSAPAPHPPQPLSQAGPDVRATAGPTDTGVDQNSVDPDTGPAGEGQPAAGLGRATPTTIAIPRIGVDAPIMTLGTNPDGTVQVPPLEQALSAGWYSPGASPGETGNAVIVGHVDSAKVGGPAVFFELGSLRPGDAITVSRDDGSQVAFTVEEVKAYPKTAFPTELVYGPNDRAGLRVVTCGGQFDEKAGSYRDNVVAFATMTG